MIVLYSLFYRKLYSIFIAYMRFTSKSTELLFVTATVIFVYTLNYCFFYLATPFYNTDAVITAKNQAFIPYGLQYRGGLRTILLQGIYRDFSTKWYSDVGSIIIDSYIIIVFVPALEFGALLALRWLLRAWDQKKCCCPK